MKKLLIFALLTAGCYKKEPSCTICVENQPFCTTVYNTDSIAVQSLLKDMTANGSLSYTLICEQ